MMRRDRHGRGMRGPLAGRNDFTGSPVPVRTPPRGAALFAECLRTSVATGMAHCPHAFVGVDIGFEDILDQCRAVVGQQGAAGQRNVGHHRAQRNRGAVPPPD